MLEPKTILSGRYEVISALGAGGMGEVYSARDLKLEREVAIKVLTGRFAEDPQALMRFDREAKALAALSHPNVISIFDFVEQDGVVFAVMELLKGKTLRGHLKITKPTWQEATNIAISIAQGLGAAHSSGVIHRDLKPENIFLTADGGIKILDFGLARLERASAAEDTSVPTESELTKVGVAMGTLPYMSPEQTRGQSLDARSDIFSLGIVFYEMLAGSRPFSGNSSADLIASILKEEPPPLEMPPDCPGGLSEAVARCLRKEPKERFQTAADLAYVLKTVIAAQATTMVPEPGSQVAMSRKTSWLPWAALLIVALVLAAGAWYLSSHGESISSIAVLPFENSSRDPDSEYLSDGVTESIINTLSQIPDLRVMARGTVFQYKGKAVDPRQVGRDLKVETVVTGRILQKGDGLVISADLVKVSDGSQLWGQQYSDRTVSDLLSVQAEISRTIIEKLRLRLSGEKQQKVSKQYTENTEAYQYFLRGRYHALKESPDDYDKALEYYQNAVQKDPLYANAYIGMAQYYSVLALHGVKPPKEAWEKYSPLMNKAVQLNPEAVEVHAADADYKWFYLWDWSAAEKSFQRGIELNPGDVEVQRFYAEYLRSRGRWEESITHARRAQELDPLSVTTNKSLATVYFWAKRYDEALERIQKTEDLDPGSAEVHDALADVYARKEMYDEAASETEKYLALSGDKEGAAMFLEAYQESGYQVAVRSLYERQLEILQMNAEEGYVSPMFFVFTYAHLDRKEEAFHWLEVAYQERSPWLVFLKTDPQFDNLRSDPRFTDLMKKVGLI